MFDAKPLEPGKPYELEIDMTMTSTRFNVGHAIRLEVTSSSFPRFERTPNGFRDLAAARDTQTSVQTILHDAEHPSRLVLPIVPSP
jgi:putative CocE/NonD family hydrolase